MASLRKEKEFLFFRPLSLAGVFEKWASVPFSRPPFFFFACLQRLPSLPLSLAPVPNSRRQQRQKLFSSIILMLQVLIYKSKILSSFFQNPSISSRTQASSAATPAPADPTLALPPLTATPGPSSAWSFHAEMTTVSLERSRSIAEELCLSFFPVPFHSSTAASAAATAFLRTRFSSFLCGSAALRKQPAIAGRPKEANTGTGRAEATPSSREAAAPSSRAAAAAEASAAAARRSLAPEAPLPRASAARGRSSPERGRRAPSCREGRELVRSAS